MASPFDQWSLEDAQIAAQLSLDEAKRLDSYRKYISGDHFQDWDGWTGAKPMPEDPLYQTILEEIPRGFVSRNALGECVGTHVNGVLGRDVRWSVVPRRKLAKDQQPSPDEQTRIDEATDLLTAWVEQRKLNQEYDKLGKHLLTDGVAYQRPFVAPGEVDGGIVPTSDLATSLGRVYFNFPLRGEAVVYTDPRTQKRCSIYLYREVVSSRPSEAAGKEGDERAELTYLDGDQTIIRIVGVDGTIIPENQVDFSLPLGRRLLISDMQRPALINEQVVSQQKLLNKTLTNMSRNNDLGGSREKITYNARMGGTLVIDPATGKEKFVADAVQTGAARMLNLTGYTTEDALGNKTLSTPGMTLVDPVPVVTFLDTARCAYENILAECKQLHTAAAGSTGISAEARLVSMAAYLIDLLQTKQQVDAGWSWLLETALALAAILAGQAGRFDDLRVSAECSVDPGPISPDQMKTVQMLAGNVPLLSVKTAQSRIGVEDTDGEEAQMEKEQAANDARFPETQPAERAFPADLNAAIGQANTLGDGTDEAPINLDSTVGLNGIQVRTAIDLLKEVADGQVAPSIAVQLLVSLGIAAEAAQRMVEAAQSFNARKLPASAPANGQPVGVGA